MALSSTKRKQILDAIMEIFIYCTTYVFSKNWITFSCRGSFDQRSKHQNILCCHFYKDDKSNSVLEEDHKCGLKIRNKVQFMDAELFFVCPKWFCLDQLLRVLMGEEKIVYNTLISAFKGNRMSHAHNFILYFSKF